MVLCMSVRRVRIIPTSGQCLRQQLLQQGMEFPCGGDGICGQCKVRVTQGEIAVTPLMEQVLLPDELNAGWRLACVSEADSPLTLEIEQWGPTDGSLRVLTDHRKVPVEPRDGLGGVVDVGTTTLVVQCVSLATGEVLATETALNSQSRWGADVMSRIRHELATPGELRDTLRQQLDGMLAGVSQGQPFREILLVGNTVMQHLFCGYPVDDLAQAPFRTKYLDAGVFAHHELGWETKVQDAVCFLPNIGGFVGSDLLAGIAATGIHLTNTAVALIDLGTNGEIAVTNGERILCASTAAGPAFEAGNIRHGMRAEPGAIHRVTVPPGTTGGAGTMGGDGTTGGGGIQEAGFCCEVLGGGVARGICGSGLVDAVACALDTGAVNPSGRLASNLRLVPLCDSLAITQKDIRELQLAKAAISSGLSILEEQLGSRVQCLYLAGAFGNYMRTSSARRLGLFPADDTRIVPAGNAALRGIRMLLLSPSGREELIADLRRRCQHVELAASEHFQDAFVDALSFPAA